jgi:hypothetical protein
LRTLACLLLLTVLGTTTRAQQSYTQYVYWVRYQNQLLFSPTLYWNNEIDNRRFINPDVQNQLIVHSRLHYRKNKWDVAGGLTWSNAYAAIPQLGHRQPLSEIRPVVEATHEEPLGKVFIQNRIRVDNRFMQTRAEETVWEESDYILRVRYRLQFRASLKQNARNQSMIMLRVADEVMFNHKNNTFDQNRIYVTTDWRLSKSVAIETGYIYIYQQRFGREEFFNRHVLRFSVLHRVQL